jgi:UDP-N-acetylglucosamine--N-acetylmuramyl-(pentapeptide) pyrophosphoryl-undecaprenol N-acetylglucosamine transferase
MQKTIVLTGGGTAGHVSPNLALLPYLLQEGYKVHYIGSKTGIERQMLKNEDLVYHAISTGKLRRYFDVKNFSDPFRVLDGALQSLKILKQIKPDVVFSKGGFVSVPVVWAAHRLHIPVLLHESDISPGLANRMCSRYAKYVCTTFPECAKLMSGKGKLTGTPLRGELFKGDREKGLKIAGFSGDKPVLLVMGGSQGSVAVNSALREALPDIAPLFDVFHICGKGNIDDTIQNPAYYQVEFMAEDLPHALACADVVLSRAGSNALSEFHALQKPMLLIPLPLGASRGDQIQNALSYESRGLAMTLMQDKLNRESLTAKLKELLSRKEQFKQALKNCPLSDGTQNVLNLIKDIQKK